MDTQGSELHVLRGATETLRHLRFVWTEVSFGGLYAGDAGLTEMMGFMSAAGFDLYHCHINRKRWGNALFIRSGVVDRWGGGRA